MIKGVHFVKCVCGGGRPRRWYVYAYRGGPCIQGTDSATKPPLAPAAVQRISELMAQSSVGPKILGAMIRRWRTSPEWANLAAGTKRTWGSLLAMIELKWGDTPLVLWSDHRMVGKVLAWRDGRASTPRAADNGVLVLRKLLEFARLLGEVSINVAEGIRSLYRGGSRPAIVWTDQDCASFVEKALELGQQHVADGLRLAALTGLRRQDLVTLTWSQVQGNTLVKRALKASRGRRRIVELPLLPAVDALLEELRTRARQPGVETVLVKSYGRSWTGDGFSGSFNQVRDAAGITHVDEDTREPRRKHLHDLRGTFCTKLVLAGVSNQDIAEAMGWSPDQVAGIRRTYVDRHCVVVAIGERIRAAL